MAKQYASAPDLSLDLSKTYSAVIHTTAGDISVDLYASDAPQAVNNFVFLANVGFYDDVGTLARANAGPNTNGSQFFIMHADYGLPNAYTIFGEVTDGLGIVDAIAEAPTGAQDRPHDPVTITGIDISES